MTTTLAALAQPAGMRITWTDKSTNEKKFQLERSVNGPTLVFALIAEPAENATVYLDTAVLENVEYAYRIRATNDAGSSLYSETAIGKIPPSIPAAPGGLTVTPLS